MTSPHDIRKQLLSKTSSTIVGPIQWREFVNRLNGGAEHSCPPGVEVKNVRSYTQILPHTGMLISP